MACTDINIDKLKAKGGITVSIAEVISVLEDEPIDAGRTLKKTKKKEDEEVTNYLKQTGDDGKCYWDSTVRVQGLLFYEQKI